RGVGRGPRIVSKVTGRTRSVHVNRPGCLGSLYILSERRSMMRLLRLFVITTGLVSLLCGTAAAQVLYGTIVGNVTDPSQGSVAGAIVTLSSKETGLTKDTKTDERGVYEFNNIQAGTYSVKIAAAGFNAFEATNIPVTVNTVSRVDA